ncbi:MAG: VTT domain-containing protein [Acidobacteria bacterium]|nr:VTT domain-containing protein [Acidobacteriota bacterium]
MSRIASWLEAFAAALGGPGLFVVAFLDSSLLSLPEINDLLVIGLAVQDPDRLAFYATMATLGSLAGCLLLYGIGRRGGAALARRRFGGRRLQRALALFERWGVLAVAVPALLPPPAPFKMFVLLAGVAGVPRWRFVAAVVCGRSIRYFGAAVLAVRYGEDAVAWADRAGSAASDAVAAHPVAVAIVSATAVAAAGAVWARRRRG